ncbi:MAG: MtaA/CmuA family methyltransferase [Actinobacteria bacterium]|nr:MtaA/CmuA family methyltransferase [Actinomycetota bacterium]
MGEQMTSRERVFAALGLKDLPDQVPVTPLLLTRSIREGNTTADVAQRNPQVMADCKLRAHAKFGGDVVAAGTDLFTPVENLGAELEYLPYAQPSQLTHPAATKEAFSRLKDEYLRRGFDPSRGRVRNVAEEIRILVAAGVKKDRVLATPVGGPITTASMLTGTSEFLTYLNEDPEYAREVIELALDCVKNICRVMFEAGVDAVNILDPFCSSDVIPPEVYRDFGLPAQKELFAYVTEIGGAGMTHTCTYTLPILEDVATNGCVNMNGDFYPGMNHAKKAIGGKLSLMGSVSPFSTLRHGTPEDVAREVKRLAVDVGYNGGWICMPGCDIDWTVPEANLRALIDTCASIKYPLDVEALGDLTGVYLPGDPRHPATRLNTTAHDPQVLAAVTGGLAANSPAQEVYRNLVQGILDYDRGRVEVWVSKGLELGLTPKELVFDGLALGMKTIGDLYERNERFVTDMLKASRTMDAAMAILAPLLEQAGSEGTVGTVVMGLVRGNTQDIGKNLVSLMLQAAGYKVIDLGKNVKPEEFVRVARENEAVAIGMSVMTDSSVPYVEEVVRLVKDAGRSEEAVLMVGGASANAKLAERLGIEYGPDANAAVAIVQKHSALAMH